MTADQVLELLQKEGSEHHRNQFTRFGISAEEAYGVTSPKIKALAKTIGRDHSLAIELYQRPIHEAKLIAAYLADPKALTTELMDEWASQVYSWDICDNLCMHLFRRSPHAETMAFRWIEDEREFVRRCGLVVMTSLSIHNKKADNQDLFRYAEVAVPYVVDERNFVKKAVSWLLRQQGKRNMEMRDLVLQQCEKIESLYGDHKSAKWILSDVRRELMKPAIVERLRKK